MAGFLDVLLRGAILVLASLVLGGVVWARVILRAGPGAPPSAAARLALRVVAAAAGAAALAQLTTLLVALRELGDAVGWPVATLAGTTFGRAATTRVALALIVGAVAIRLGRGPAGAGAWRALELGA